MKIRQVIVMLIIFIMALSGCQRQDTDINNTDKLNFESYANNDDIYNITQVSLNNRLSKECVSYKFSYSSDGYEVKAYISIPLHCIETATPTKCIVYNRGGNSKIGLLSNEDTAQICSATNRVVVASQYRGSDGSTGTDQFGGEDINDVIKLIDMCDNTFNFVDMNDLCIAGVSRGGMMSYMIARQDKRVKGIIAISAVSDLFQAYKERDDMKTILENYIGETPESAPDEYEKRSAIYWADEIDVPTLIIHSKQDEQVSYSQAEAMFDKLKLTNKNCSLVSYNDSVHGLHKDDCEKVSDWINQTFG